VNTIKTAGGLTFFVRFGGHRLLGIGIARLRHACAGVEGESSAPAGVGWL
jgi:hypothetical protein